jgi:cell division protein FtsQ
VLALLAAGALAWGYLGWFRDSSLVAVNDVRVEGVTSSDGDQVVAALTAAAKEMTTLHVQMGPLVEAAGRFPTVASVSADASFPHGLTIHVTERHPVLIASAAGNEVPVAADGTILAGLPADGKGLPTLRVDQIPAAGTLDGTALHEALVIGAAPAPLLKAIEGATLSPRYGIVVNLTGGIPVRFGNASQAASKWAAAAAVLADPKLTSVSYVDVRVAHRPAAGGAAPAAVTTATTPDATVTDPALTTPSAATTTTVAP